MLLLTFASLVTVAAAQTFSFGIGLGSAGDVIPAFDSQRSSAVSSSQNHNPFTSFSGAGRSNLKFEDFFSSSRIASPQSSVDARERSPARTSVQLPVRTPTQSPPRSEVESPARTPAQSPARTFPQSPSQTSTPASSRTSSRSSSSPSRNPSSPNPVITSRGAPVAAVSSPARETTRQGSTFQTSGLGVSTLQSSPFQPVSSSRPKGGVVTVQASRDVSSRGREQDSIPRQPSVTRPPSTTETNEVLDPRENLVGQSICARGTIGDACRQHLANTAMSCTSGFCHECQQCGNLSPELWPKCCREHFLCCRPLAKACQACDSPALRPFCGAAFGRCH